MMNMLNTVISQIPQQMTISALPSISGISTPIPVPPRFQHCTDIYRPDKDYKYADCNITDGSDPCKLLKELHRAKEFRTYFLAILPIILATIALILNVIYLIIQIRVYLIEDHSYRKRYIFLISRTLSTIIAVILLYVVVATWKTEGFQYSNATIFILIAAINFLSVTGTYIALTILLYIAVRHQFWYRSELRMKHCYFAVALIWICSLGSAICIGIWGATLFYPKTAPIQCSYEGCQRPLAIIIVVGLSICYSTVLALYAIMFWRLSRRSIDGQSTNSTKIGMIAMKRLSMNMATFAVGSIPILICSIVTLANLKRLSSLGVDDKSPCKTYLNSRLFVEVETLASVAGIVWILAMILDPIINTLADHKLMKLIKDGASKFSKSVKNSWESRISKKSKFSSMDKNLTTTDNDENGNHIQNEAQNEPSTTVTANPENPAADNSETSETTVENSENSENTSK